MSAISRYMLETYKQMFAALAPHIPQEIESLSPEGQRTLSQGEEIVKMLEELHQHEEVGADVARLRELIQIEIAAFKTVEDLNLAKRTVLQGLLEAEDMQ